MSRTTKNSNMSELVNIFKYHNDFFDRYKDSIILLEKYILPLKIDENFTDTKFIKDVIEHTEFSNFPQTIVSFSGKGTSFIDYSSFRYIKLYVLRTKKCIKFGFRYDDNKTIYFSYGKNYSFISTTRRWTWEEDTISATRSYKFSEDKMLEKSLIANPAKFLPNHIINCEIKNNLLL